jgi:osmotically-inducible protein OsmY
MIPYFPSDDPLFRQWLRPSDPPTDTDEDLALRVAARLRPELTTPGHHIVVEVQNRVVILEGIVPTLWVCARVHEATWQVSGVADVSNRLAVWSDDAAGRR